jgi:hypothetical protein
MLYVCVCAHLEIKVAVVEALLVTSRAKFSLTVCVINLGAAAGFGRSSRQGLGLDCDVCTVVCVCGEGLAVREGWVRCLS